MQVDQALTGLTVTSQLSKSNIDVALDANGGGEAYPLAYVLVCERVAAASPSPAPAAPGGRRGGGAGQERAQEGW